MPIEIESPEQLGYGNIRCNLAESSVTDRKLGELNIDIGNLVLAYGNHYGKPGLRELIAAKYPGISSDDVLITAGAANALFIVTTALLSAQDRIVVEFPNYSTNIETPLAIGCEVVRLELRFENLFRIDMEELKNLVTSNTKLISITTPHNPTGTVINENELRALIEIAEKNNCILLVDETYRDLSFAAPTPLAASLSENVISVSSLSKAFGLPGIRIGWIVSRNRKLMETFLAAKEQILLANSVLDEEVAAHFLQREQSWLETMRADVQQKFSLVNEWMNNNPHFEWIRPAGGVVCFPRLKKTTQVDFANFYNVLIEKYSTLVGGGHWFGMSNRYMRIGYGWPSVDELSEGLRNIQRALGEI